MSERYLTLQTKEAWIRSEVHGWNYQDISLIDVEKPIGASREWSSSEFDPHPVYSCVAFALADGWELLGSPIPTPDVESTDPESQHVYYTWFLRQPRPKTFRI